MLFLDELPEFHRQTLEALRQPLESGSITISRAKQQLTFPACFQLIAAMNPCPCGYYGDVDHACRCTAQQIAHYQHKLSGPLLDRIDLHIDVPRIAYQDLQQPPSSTITSLTLREKMTKIQALQYQRQGYLNTHLSAKALDHYCALKKAEDSFFLRTCEALKLSMRSAKKILKIARTIADIESSGTIEKSHLIEALGFRGH